MYFFCLETQTKKARRIESVLSSRTNVILVFCPVIGIIVTVGMIFAVILMILHW